MGKRSGKKSRKNGLSSGKAPADTSLNASISLDPPCKIDPFPNSSTSLDPPFPNSSTSLDPPCKIDPFPNSSTSAAPLLASCNLDPFFDSSLPCLGDLNPSPDAPVPSFCNSIAGRFTTLKSGNGFFNIEVGVNTYPVNQLIVNGKKKYALIVEEYDKSLTEWIKDTETMEVVYKGTDYAIEQPTEAAKMVVQALITKFCDQVASGENHCNLKCLDDYLLTFPVYDHHSTSAHKYAEERLDKAGEYVDKVKVIIVRDAKLGEPTTTLERRTSAIIEIIFDDIFKGRNELQEWKDLRVALEMGNFSYADCHPCLWSWKKRLIFFVDLSSYISNRNDELNSIAYKAVVATDLFKKDWRLKLDEKDMAPLKRVLQHNHDKDDGQNTSDAASSSEGKFSQNDGQKSWKQGKHQKHWTNEQTRWKEGKHQIRWMKNCFNHLTEQRTDRYGQGYFLNIDYITDGPLFMDLRFFNHVVTHRLYPELWIKLFSNLHKGGYRI